MQCFITVVNLFILWRRNILFLYDTSQCLDRFDEFSFNTRIFLTCVNVHIRAISCVTPAAHGDINTLKPELNPICYLLALLGNHHFLHVSRIRVKLLTFRLLMSYIYGAPILDVSRSHTTTQHSR